MFIVPTLLAAVLVGSTPDSLSQVLEPSRPDSTVAIPASPVTVSFGVSYGGLLLPTTDFGSGLQPKRMVQGPSDLRTRTFGLHFGLSGEHLGGSFECQWLRGDGIAPSANLGQFPTHGERLSGFLWGGSLDVFGAPSSASIRPVASAGLRYLSLHRRLDHDTLAVGQMPPSFSPPSASVETSFDQKGFLLDLSAGIRLRLGQATFLDARLGALSGDALGSESMTTSSKARVLNDSRHLDPYVRFGLFFDGVPSWMSSLGAGLRGNPGSPPVFKPL